MDFMNGIRFIYTHAVCDHGIPDINVDFFLPETM